MRTPTHRRSARKTGLALRVFPGAPQASLHGTTNLAGSRGEAITITRAGAAFATLGDGSLVSMASNVGRIVPLGLQVEPAATNICLQSQTFDNATWTKIGSGSSPTVTANAATAPDGTATADQIDIPAVSGGSAYALLRQSIVVTAVSHVASVWLKTSSGTATVWIGMSGGDSETQCAVTSTWTRFTCTQTLTNGGRNFDIGVNRFEANQTDQGAQTIFAWGAQLEVASVVSSYVATTVAGVARALEQVALPVTGISHTQGSLAFDVTPQRALSSNEALFVLNSAAGANEIYGFQSASGTTNIQTKNNAGTSTEANGSVSFPAGTRKRYRVTWNASAVTVYVNNVQICATDGTNVPEAAFAVFRMLGQNTDTTGIPMATFSNLVVGKTIHAAR